MFASKNSFLCVIIISKNIFSQKSFSKYFCLDKSASGEKTQNGRATPSKKNSLPSPLYAISMEPVIGLTMLPHVLSSKFGLGIGVLSTGQSASDAMASAFGHKRNRNTVSVPGLVAKLPLAEKMLQEEREQKGKTSAIGCEFATKFADLLRGTNCEWVVFDSGTAVPLNDASVKPIHTIAEFAHAFRAYPFHRFRSDPSDMLAKCFLHGSRIEPVEARIKASRATRILLDAGYPMPGCNADRYVFLPHQDMALVWMVDDPLVLSEYARRQATPEESALMAREHDPDYAKSIPTIVDEQFEEHMLRSPLTLVLLNHVIHANLIPPDNRMALYHAGSDCGAEGRRLDFMLPTPVALVSTTGQVTMF